MASLAMENGEGSGLLESILGRFAHGGGRCALVGRKGCLPRIDAHYIEPRTHDGRSPHADFRVIWINKKDRQAVVLASQSTAQWTTVVRAGSRFGLRVKSAEAKIIHEQHKPQTPYLESDEILTFHAGPFPHGSNRGALLKLFST